MTLQYRYAVWDAHGDLIESGQTADTPEAALAKAQAWELLEGVLDVDGPHLVLMRRHAATEWERDDADRPTLDRETIARAIWQAFGQDYDDILANDRDIVQMQADAVLALIEAAQPGLIR